MRSYCRLATGLVLCTLFAAPVWAQTQGSPSQSTPPPTDDSATRPATTTVLGDTGLWYVPTGEVLPKGRWSFSAYRTNWDRTEAFTDISNFRGTFAFGASDHVELFGSVDVQRRIDADRRPVRAGGTPMDDPHVFQQWGTGVGDIRVGAKFNLTAPYRQQPAAFAIRTLVKIPTSDTDEGLGTGKLDFLVDAIISGEAAQSVELSGFGGFMHRGDPDEYDLSGGLRWGFGAGFPSRSKLRVTTELTGEMYFDDEIWRAASSTVPLRVGKSNRQPISSLASPTRPAMASSSATEPRTVSIRRTAAMCLAPRSASPRRSTDGATRFVSDGILACASTWRHRRRPHRRHHPRHRTVHPRSRRAANRAWSKSAAPQR